MQSNGASEVMYYVGPLLSLFGAGGGAWLALKVGLNGAKDRIRNIEGITERIETAVHKAENKLSVLESKHETLSTIVKEHPLSCPWQPRNSSARTRRDDHG